MISAWHLLWIVPVAGTIGFLISAFLSTIPDEDGEYNEDEYEHEYDEDEEF